MLTEDEKRLLPLNEADTIESRAMSCLCAMMYLDDIGISRIDQESGETYSLVGRIKILESKGK